MPLPPERRHDDVQLREYLEQRLDYERTLVSQRFEQLERLLETHRLATDKALHVQATEYERRLTVLNHAHEAAVKEQNRVLPRETFQAFLDDFMKWRDMVNSAVVNSTGLTERVMNIQTRLDQFSKDYEIFRLATSSTLTAIATRSITWTAAIGLIVVLIGIALRFVGSGP
jgi:hypothetical protein